MRLRDARPQDADAIAAVARAAWHAAYDDLLGAETIDRTVDRWYDPSALRAELAGVADAKEEHFLVATVDGDIVGFAGVGAARRDDSPADAFLSRLYVHPDRWGKGAGTALAGDAFDRLRATGRESVWLEVFEANDVGRSFYESLGFERVASVEETFGNETLATLHLRASLARLPTGR